MFCFECNSIKCVSKDTSCKQHLIMNEIVYKCLLIGDKFMPQMHLKQPGFTYSACKKGTSIVNAFKKVISEGSESESKLVRKPNKVVNFIIIL